MREPGSRTRETLEAIAQALRTKQVIVLQAPFLALGHTLWRLTRIGSRAGPVQRAFSEFVR